MGLGCEGDIKGEIIRNPIFRAWPSVKYYSKYIKMLNLRIDLKERQLLSW